MSQKTTTSNVRGKAAKSASKSYGMGHKAHLSAAMKSTKQGTINRTATLPPLKAKAVPRGSIAAPKSAQGRPIKSAHTPNIRGTVAPSRGGFKRR